MFRGRLSIIKLKITTEVTNSFIISRNLIMKYNTTIERYNICQINKILFQPRSEITIAYSEKLCIEETRKEFLSKYYPKDISFSSINKVGIYMESNKLIRPFFLEIFFTSYFKKIAAIKFEYVNWMKFSEYDHLDISWKSFFNDENLAEIENDLFIENQRNKHFNQSNKKWLSQQANIGRERFEERWVNLICTIDYYEKIRELNIKRKEDEKNKEDTIELLDIQGEKGKKRRSVSMFSNTVFVRRKGRWGGVKMWRNSNNKVHDIIAEEEKRIQSLLENKLERRRIKLETKKQKLLSKFKSITHFLKKQKHIDGKKSREKSQMEQWFWNVNMHLYLATEEENSKSTKPSITSYNQRHQLNNNTLSSMKNYNQKFRVISSTPIKWKTKSFSRHMNMVTNLQDNKTNKSSNNLNFYNIPLTAKTKLERNSNYINNKTIKQLKYKKLLLGNTFFTSSTLKKENNSKGTNDKRVDKCTMSIPNIKKVNNISRWTKNDKIPGAMNTTPGKSLLGIFDESRNKIPWLCHKISKSTVTHLTTYVSSSNNK